MAAIAAVHAATYLAETLARRAKAQTAELHEEDLHALGLLTAWCRFRRRHDAPPSPAEAAEASSLRTIWGDEDDAYGAVAADVVERLAPLWLGRSPR